MSRVKVSPCTFAGQFYEGEEGVDALTEQGQATLERLENMIQIGQGDNSVQNGHNNTGERA